MVETLIYLLIALVILGVFAWLAHWVITSYFPEPAKTPALLITGVIFLIVLLLLFLRWFQGVPLRT
jgi:hypothetical protein